MRDGLKPYSPASSNEGYLHPYICLSTSPSAGWSLSGDARGRDDIHEWDLYQVVINHNDDIEIRSDLGPCINEVRTFTAIPTDRIWWVARRERRPAVEVQKPRTRQRTQPRKRK